MNLIMKNKYYIWVILCLISIICFSCYEEPMDHGQGNSNSDLEAFFTATEAREFFENKMEKSATKSSGTVASKTNNGLTSGEFTPQWNKAKISQNDIIGSVGVPIISEFRYMAIRSEFVKGKAKAYSVMLSQQLLVVKGKQHNKISQYILTLIPDRAYYSKNKGDISDKFLHSGDKGGFSGIAIYSRIENSSPIKINRYRDGKILGGVHFSKNDSEFDAKKVLAQRFIGPISIKRGTIIDTRFSGGECEYEPEDCVGDVCGNGNSGCDIFCGDHCACNNQCANCQKTGCDGSECEVDAVSCETCGKQLYDGESCDCQPCHVCNNALLDDWGKCENGCCFVCDSEACECDPCSICNDGLLDDWGDCENGCCSECESEICDCPYYCPDCADHDNCSCCSSYYCECESYCECETCPFDCGNIGCKGECQTCPYECGTEGCYGECHICPHQCGTPYCEGECQECGHQKCEECKLCISTATRYSFPDVCSDFCICLPSINLVPSSFVTLGNSYSITATVSPQHFSNIPIRFRISSSASDVGGPIEVDGISTGNVWSLTRTAFTGSTVTIKAILTYSNNNYSRSVSIRKLLPNASTAASSVMSDLNSEWDKSKDYHSATSTLGSQREFGGWIYINTSDGQYSYVSQATHLQDGYFTPVTPSNTATLREGGNIAVAVFHTHPPLSYYYFPGYERPTGLSGIDETYSTDWKVSVIAYDYAMPLLTVGHDIDAPAILYIKQYFGL